MAYLGGQTTTTTLPEMSSEEKALLNFATGPGLETYMSSQGYKLYKSEQPVEDTDKYKSLNTSANDARARLDAVSGNPDLQAYKGGRYAGLNQAEMEHMAQEERRLQGEYDRTQNELNTYTSEYKPSITYDVAETPTQEIKGIVETYGKESIEYQNAMKDYRGKITNKEKREEQIYTQFMDQAQKFLNGDFSITDSQQKYIKDLYAPQREAVAAMRADIEAEASKTEAQIRKEQEKAAEQFYITEKGIREEIGVAEKATRAEIETGEARARKGLGRYIEEAERTGKGLEAEASGAERVSRETAFETESRVGRAFQGIMDQINATGLEVGVALDIVGTQIRQTGSDMQTALNSTINISKQLLDMGIKDFTGQFVKKVATNAALLGRSPDDPEYAMEVQTTVAREIERGGLELSRMAAQGNLQISERTGAALENLALQKAEMARSQGGKKEAVAGERAGLAERTGQKLEAGADVAAQRRMAIGERTGGAREAAAMEDINLIDRASQRLQELTMQTGQLRIGAAERTGVGLEGLAAQRTALAERTGQMRETAAAQYGQQMAGLAGQESQAQYQMGAAMPLTQIGLGVDVSQYNQALQQQRVANAAQLYQQPLGMAQYMRQERFAQPSQTTQKGYGLGDAFSDVLGVAGGAAAAYGGIESGGLMSAQTGLYKGLTDRLMR